MPPPRIITYGITNDSTLAASPYKPAFWERILYNCEILRNLLRDKYGGASPVEFVPEEVAGVFISAPPNYYDVVPIGGGAFNAQWVLEFDKIVRALPGKIVIPVIVTDNGFSENGTVLRKARAITPGNDRTYVAGKGFVVNVAQLKVPTTMAHETGHVGGYRNAHTDDIHSTAASDVMRDDAQGDTADDNYFSSLLRIGSGIGVGIGDVIA